MGTYPVPSAGRAFSLLSRDVCAASAEASAENLNVSTVEQPDRRMLVRRIRRARGLNDICLLSFYTFGFMGAFIAVRDRP